MYQITVRSASILDAAMVHVSICEIDENGSCSVLATAAHLETSCLAGDSDGSLANFCEQTALGVASALSTGQAVIDDRQQS